MSKARSPKIAADPLQVTAISILLSMRSAMTPPKGDATSMTTLQRELTIPRATLEPVISNTSQPCATLAVCMAAVKQNIAHRNRRNPGTLSGPGALDVGTAVDGWMVCIYSTD